MKYEEKSKSCFHHLILSLHCNHIDVIQNLLSPIKMRFSCAKNSVCQSVDVLVKRKEMFFFGWMSCVDVWECVLKGVIPLLWFLSEKCAMQIFGLFFGGLYSARMWIKWKDNLPRFWFEREMLFWNHIHTLHCLLIFLVWLFFCFLGGEITILSDRRV